MESLAALVAILFLVMLASGPISIGLSSGAAKRFTEGSALLTWIRRLLMGFLVIIGIFISIPFFYNDSPLAPKVLAILCIAGNVWALRREYGRPKNGSAE